MKQSIRAISFMIFFLIFLPNPFPSKSKIYNTQIIRTDGLKSSMSENFTILWEYNDVSTIGDVAISSDGSYIACLNSNNLTLFRSNSSIPLWTSLYGGGKVEISSDGQYIATVGNNQGLYFYNKTDPTPLWHYAAAFKEVEWMDLSSDGAYIVTTGLYGSPGVNLFHRSSNVPIWSYGSGSYSAVGIAISSDGSYFAVSRYGSGGNGEVPVYNRSGSSVSLYRNYFISGNYPFSVDISEDGTIIAAGAQYPTGALLYDRSKATPILNYQNIHCWSIALSSDGNYEVAGTWDMGLFLFERSNPEPLWNISMTGEIHDLAISSNGSYIIASLGANFFAFNKLSSDPLVDLDLGNTVNGLDISGVGNITVLCSSNSLITLIHTYIPEIENDDNPNKEENNNPETISNSSLYILIGLFFIISIQKYKKVVQNKINP